MHSSFKLSILITVCLFICLINGQGGAFQPRVRENYEKEKKEEAMKQISKGSEKFSLKLFELLSNSNELKDNFIISPFSIWSLLILTAEGADGNTLHELLTVLGLPKDLIYIQEEYKHIQAALLVNTSTIDLAVNNALITDENRPVDHEFEKLLTDTYRADLVPVNFYENEKACNTINEFVRNKTRGKINTIVKPDDLKDAQMMLISAIFFKGQWKIPFNISFTKKEPFYDENLNNLGNVDMMYMSEILPFVNFKKLSALALEIPYGKEDRLSMLIFLPYKGSTVKSLLSQLQTFNMSEILSALNETIYKYDDKIDVYLPRFKITSDFVLNGILENMGLLDIFDQHSADLSRLSKVKMYLSRIVHKAQIEVNEEGTIATAVTGGSFINKNSPPRFYANRPFAYFIIEKSKNIVIFSGQVRNPLQ